MKFYALFKKRSLILPDASQTLTPNGTPEQVKEKRQARNQSNFGGDEVVLKLLPKIFDDAFEK